MFRVAVFCLSLFASGSLMASDLGIQYKQLWADAKWDESEACGKIKANLIDKITTQLKKQPVPLELVKVEFDTQYDSLNECRIARSGYLEFANGDICSGFIFSNRFLIESDRPSMSLRLECMGRDQRASFHNVRVGL